MLRITRLPSDDATTLLKLEGKLLEPWIEELLASVHHAKSHSTSLKLDLSSLNFVDSAGARTLTKLLRQGAGLTACSGYLAALLHVEKP